MKEAKVALDKSVCFVPEAECCNQATSHFAASKQQLPEDKCRTLAQVGPSQPARARPRHQAPKTHNNNSSFRFQYNSPIPSSAQLTSKASTWRYTSKGSAELN